MKRLSAAAIAFFAFLALVLQFYLNGEKPGLENWALRGWDLMRYFTILTNSLVMILMAREAAGQPAGKNWLATAALNMTMVGIIFQLLLAPPVPLQGLAWLPDFLFHAAVPLTMLVWWALWAPKNTGFPDLPRWLLWPVAYCLYILIRAAFDGNYVYFFLDIKTFGTPAIALNILGLVLVFAAFGALMVFAAKRLNR
jgi:hypothetical protein